MGESHSDAELQEALAALQNYLSDRIPPLMASASIEPLLDQPAQWIASEIQSWIASQYGSGSSRLSVAEYIYHAMKKLHDFVQLRLLPSRTMGACLKNLELPLLQFCPEAERTWLKQSLDSLGHAETTLAPAVGFIYHPVEARESGPAGRRTAGVGDGSDEESARRGRRFSLMLDHLQQEGGTVPSELPQPPPVQEERVSHVIATAAANARSEADLQQIQKVLSMIGEGSGTAQVFRRLSQSLPGWLIPVGAEQSGGSAPSQNSSLTAMRQVLRLAEDRVEVSRRFTELVQSAIEQFNTGSLAKAVTMLDLSERLAAEEPIDADTVTHVRSEAHDSLDLTRLRSYAEKPEKHHLLRKVLAYFHELSPERLLDRLQEEPKRDRRRLLLNLLETQGQAARTAAFERLESLAGEPHLAGQWFFPRNLITVLTRIPRPEKWGPDPEINLVASFLQLSYTAPLVREAITLLGQIQQPAAEQLLIGLLEETEKTLLAAEPSGSAQTGLFSILDRLVSTLTRYGTAKASRAVIQHGLKQDEELGYTLGRLAHLSGQDLSADPDSLDPLVSALKARIPRKVLGVVLQGDIEGQLILIKALSGTPAPSVRTLFEQIAARCPDKESGKAASKALRGFGENHQPEDARGDRLLGDLEIFGLPDLLRQFVRTRLTGTLTLKDSHGEVAGVVVLRHGQLENCHAGSLEGKSAVYHLLINPIPGTFVFMGKKHVQTKEPSASSPDQDLTPLIQEGMRRYDELQKARALVPDGCHLKPAGPDPEPRSDEEDPVLFHRIWSRVKAGATPEECEAESPVRACTIRLLLARWVEDSALVLQYGSPHRSPTGAT